MDSVTLRNLRRAVGWKKKGGSRQLVRHNSVKRWQRESNEKYNYFVLSTLGLGEVKPKQSDEIAREQYSTGEAPIRGGDSNTFQVAWFRNLDRLVDMLPNELELGQLDFVDVGCGSGEVLVYMGTFYSFKSVSGFDVSRDLVRAANSNLNKIRVEKSPEDTSLLNKAICLDARKHQMTPSRTMFFMFNPFGWITADTWLSENLETLAETGSFLAISNDVWLGPLLDKYGPLRYIRNDTYNISLICF